MRAAYLTVISPFRSLYARESEGGSYRGVSKILKDLNIIFNWSGWWELPARGGSAFWRKPNLVGPPGFEPGLNPPEGLVLPLHYGPIISLLSFYSSGLQMFEKFDLSEALDRVFPDIISSKLSSSFFGKHNEFAFDFFDHFYYTLERNRTPISPLGRACSIH